MNYLAGVRRFSTCVLASLGLVFAFTQKNALAIDVSGIRIEDTVRVANQDLKLNGAGIRTKAIFKVYVAGLYLNEKKSIPAEIYVSPAAKRLTLVMMREVSAEQFGQSFMDGMNHNVSKAEKAKIIDQMMKFGEMFSKIPELKKGDVVTTDWLPGSGTLVQLNGKKIAEIFPDVAFFNALLKIWLGEKPAQDSLKKQLLGEKPEEVKRPAREY